MSSVSKIFWDEERKVVLCLQCHCAISPGQVGRHLQQSHADIDLETRKEENQKVYLGQIGPGDEDGVARAEALGFSPVLAHHPGWACGAEGCRWAAQAESTFRKHVAEKHSEAREKPGQRKTKVQALFPRGRWFEVEVPGEGVGEGRSTGQEGTRLVTAIAQYELELRIQAVAVPTIVNHHQLTMWDKKTRWAYFHAGHTMDDLTARSAVSSPGDGEEMALVMSTMKGVLESQWMDLGDVPEYTRRVFASIGLELSTKPLYKINVQTLNHYANAWQSMLGFLLRSVKPGAPDLVWEPRVVEGLRQIAAGGFSGAGEEGMRRLRGLLLDISVHLVRDST